MTNTLPWSSRISARAIYGRLLLLYPEDLRRDYGADMALVFAEDLDSARREAGMRGAIRVWRCALSEFLRFALPGYASRPAVRVPVISSALSIVMMSGVMTMALRHAPHAPRPLQAVCAALLLPLFCTPLVSLVSVWACRGNAVMSLNLSQHTGEER